MELRAKKSLGQHFLTSQHVLSQIIAAANIQKDEGILEIGPGTGILTEALLKSGARVTAVEKDNRSVIVLQEKFPAEIADGRLTLVLGDILELQLPDSHAVTGATMPLPASYALVANIPYYITGAILEKFLEYAPRPTRMVLLVQKEVAKRILGSLPGGEGSESVLSNSVKAFGVPKIVATVPPGAFTPPPSIDSAILSITDISDRAFTKHGLTPRRFFEVVRAGFAHKRKILIRNLETIAPLRTLETAWQELAIGKNIRAEELSPDTWLTLAARLG